MSEEKRVVASHYRTQKRCSDLAGSLDNQA